MTVMLMKMWSLCTLLVSVPVLLAGQTGSFLAGDVSDDRKTRLVYGHHVGTDGRCAIFK